MSAPAPTPTLRTFRLDGSVSLFVPVVQLVKGDAEHVPRRRMAGWLTTYGKLRADGGVEPTVDRDGQVMEASSGLGSIDWSGYIRGGLWNDGHRARLPDGSWPPTARGPQGREVFVGVPTALDFHDGSTPLSLAHGKVGFFTSGHLWDRDDPASWELYTDHVPNEEELARADHFWRTAEALEGTGAALGFSAHGLARLSPCRRRILFAQITQAAILGGPRNPDSTVELVKGDDGVDVLPPPARAEDPGRVFGLALPAERVSPCGACRCDGGPCRREVLAKGIEDRADSAGYRSAASSIGTGLLSGSDMPEEPIPGEKAMGEPVVVPQDLEGRVTTADLERARSALVLRIMALFQCDEATANRWIDQYQPRTSA